MVSRKGSIIALAVTETQTLAEYYKEGSRARANAERINAICRALLQKKRPELPTAGIVAEIGGLTDAKFISEQTIYNNYRKVLGRWRSAYYLIVNIDAEDPIEVDQVSKINTSTMDSSTAVIVEQLKVIIFELTQRINVLKHLHDVSIPVPASGVVQQLDSDRIMGRWRDWMEAVANSAFDLDEIGLRVTRRTPIGTRIMQRELFDELKIFVEDYQRIRKAQAAAAV